MSIYETVPVDVELAPSMIEKIELYLRMTKGQVSTAKQIAQAVGLPDRGTHVEVRKAITILLEEEGFPIVASGRGFTWATNKSQLIVYFNSLKERQAGLDRRLKAVEKIIFELSLGGA